MVGKEREGFVEKSVDVVGKVKLVVAGVAAFFGYYGEAAMLGVIDLGAAKLLREQRLKQTS